MTILSQIQEIHIGPFTFYTYGIIIGIAITLSILIFWKNTSEEIKYSKYILWLILTVLIFGIIGARLSYYLIHYSTSNELILTELLQFWSGGTTIFGAIIGGFVGYTLFWKLIISKSSTLDFWKILDNVAPALALGQAVGRVANFINQELFGPPTQLPWGISIPEQFRPDVYSNQTKFHPTFAYELVLNMLSFTFLSRIYKQKIKHPGILTATYLINYGLIRLIIERFRVDTQPILEPLKLFDLLSILFILSGVTILTIKNAKNAKTKN